MVLFGGGEGQTFRIIRRKRDLCLTENYLLFGLENVRELCSFTFVLEN